MEENPAVTSCINAFNKKCVRPAVAKIFRDAVAIEIKIRYAIVESMFACGNAVFGIDCGTWKIRFCTAKKEAIIGRACAWAIYIEVNVNTFFWSVRIIRPTSDDPIGLISPIDNGT